MKLSCSLLIASQVLSVLALPAPNGAGRVAVVATSAATAVASTTAAADAAATTTAAAEVGEGAGGEAGGEAGAEEGAENEVEVQAQFGEVVQLQGGDLKQDVLYPPGVSLSLKRPAPYRSLTVNQDQRRLRD